uniref:Uncharacterized protein n=1 Tax=Lepeophtheirus salmonis TaxID=72036 RepID=A0A0K2TKG6_LEPSM
MMEEEMWINFGVRLSSSHWFIVTSSWKIEWLIS